MLMNAWQKSKTGLEATTDAVMAQRRGELMKLTYMELLASMRPELQQAVESLAQAPL